MIPKSILGEKNHILKFDCTYSDMISIFQLVFGLKCILYLMTTKIKIVRVSIRESTFHISKRTKPSKRVSRVLLVRRDHRSGDVVFGTSSSWRNFATWMSCFMSNFVWQAPTRAPAYKTSEPNPMLLSGAFTGLFRSP